MIAVLDSNSRADPQKFGSLKGLLMEKRGLNCVLKLFIKPAWTVQANASSK